MRGPHVEGRWPYAQVIRELIGGREPVALIPARPAPGQLQVRIYDRQQESCQQSIEPSGTERRMRHQPPRQPRATSRQMDGIRDQGTGHDLPSRAARAACRTYAREADLGHPDEVLDVLVSPPSLCVRRSTAPTTRILSSNASIRACNCGDGLSATTSSGDGRRRASQAHR